jgi:hypothetical protein
MPPSYRTGIAMKSEPNRKCVVTLRPLLNNAPLIVGASQ